MLVLNEFLEPAWRATLDGRKASVFRVNGNQMAVRIPAGDRVVEFHYRPRSLTTGLGLAVAGLIALLVLPFGWRRVRWPGARAAAGDATREAAS